MNKLVELEASMRVLKLQNETPTVVDGNELLLLSRFMEYKESHPRTTQREICRLINIPESRLLAAKKRHGLTKTRKRKPKKTDGEGNPVPARKGRPRTKQQPRTVRGGDIGTDDDPIESQELRKEVTFKDPIVPPSRSKSMI